MRSRLTVLVLDSTNTVLWHALASLGTVHHAVVEAKQLFPGRTIEVAGPSWMLGHAFPGHVIQ